MLDIIQAIKDAKIAQVQFAQFSLQDRLEKLKKISSIAEDKNIDETCICPTGLVTIILPKILTYQTLMDRLIPALLAGNAVLIKLPSCHNPWLEDLQDRISEANLPNGLVHFINGKGSEIGSFLCSHPAINAITAVGKPETIDQILKLPNIARKKLQLASAGSNSAIILVEELNDDSADLLIQACFQDGGTLPWSIKKIFLKETVSEKIVSQLVNKAKSVATKYNSEIGPAIIEQIKAEGGKILCGDGQSPTLVLDLPHCSALQQDSLAAPIVLISTVKYLHEAIKWANTGYLGLANMIIGDEEKARKLAAKLECGHLWINTWKTEQDGIITGVKQSFAGIRDFHFFGDFYSNRKKIVASV